MHNHYVNPMSRERGLVSLMYSIFFCVENLLTINSRWIETGRRRRHRDRQAELETSEEMVMKISIILSKYCIVNIPTLLTQLLYAYFLCSNNGKWVFKTYEHVGNLDWIVIVPYFIFDRAVLINNHVLISPIIMSLLRNLMLW